MESSEPKKLNINTNGDSNEIIGGDQIEANRDVIVGDQNITQGDSIEGDKNITNTYNIPTPTANALHQLTPPPKIFTGRDDELKELMDKIKTGGVTISGVQGMAGVGKTALALKLAEQLTPQYPDAQILYDLRGADEQEPRTTAEAMCHVLWSFDNSRPLPDEEDQLHALYMSELTDKKVLLLMDNAAGAEQVETLVPPDGNVLLVTSRQHFTIPGLSPIDLNTLQPESAVVLLIKICDRIGDSAADIAELCGFLPLALTVAGSALKNRRDITPEDYIDRLKKKRLDHLDGVEASIALSESMLPKELRDRFHALSVFPESFNRYAATYVWEYDDPHDTQAHDQLSKLVEYSLLQWDEKTDRYQLHDLVRLFAVKQISENVKYSLYLRYTNFYYLILTHADNLYLKHGEDSLEALALIDLELNNIRVGFEWIARNYKLNNDITLLCSCYIDAGTHCLHLRLHPQELIRWLKITIDAVERLNDEEAQAIHIGNLGNVFLILGDMINAEEMLRKSLYLNEKLGRELGMAKCYTNISLILQERGDLENAELMSQKAIEINEKNNLLEETADCYGNLGIVLQKRGDHEGALNMFRKSLKINDNLERLTGLAGDYGNIGNALQQLGDLDGAEKMYQEVLNIEDNLGRSESMANAYTNLGTIFHKRGNFDKARLCWINALDLFKQIGITLWVDQVQGWIDELENPDQQE